MAALLFAILATIAASAFCSMLEAAVSGATPAEIEALKRKSKPRGKMLETFAREADRTARAMLAANAAITVFGAALSGALFCVRFGDGPLAKYAFPAALAIAVLLFSEMLSRVAGAILRPALQPFAVGVVAWLRILFYPVSELPRRLAGKIANRPPASASDDEIILLANRGERDGLLSPQERDLIKNSLSLDDVPISEIMTPRTVVMALDENMTIGEVFREHPHLGFSRIPVYKDSIDNITGIVRRRDILTAKANDLDSMVIGSLKSPAIFVPENGSALSVLRQLIKKHQQIGIAVDEFASLTGVVSLEDIFERLLGSEIFEPDDIAVDMRELARKKSAISRRGAAEAKKSKAGGRAK